MAQSTQSTEVMWFMVVLMEQSYIIPNFYMVYSMPNIRIYFLKQRIVLKKNLISEVSRIVLVDLAWNTPYIYITTTKTNKHHGRDNPAAAEQLVRNFYSIIHTSEDFEILYI